MYQPKLYSSSNNCAIETLAYAFRKYKYLLKFNKNESILEIGTGDGRVTVEQLFPLLPKDVKEFIAIDKSKIMLDHAREMDALSRTTFVELDIETKEIPKNFRNRFDHIFSFWTFHFVSDTSQAFQNIYNMLKPGGETFCVFLSETPADEAWSKLSKHPRWSKYDPNHWVSPYYQNPKILEIYEKCMEDSGFKNILLQHDCKQYDFGSEKEFTDLMTSVNLSVSKIPIEELDAYLADYFKLFRNSKMWSTKKSKNGEELPSTPMHFVVLYGQKI